MKLLFFWPYRFFQILTRRLVKSKIPIELAGAILLVGLLWYWGFTYEEMFHSVSRFLEHIFLSIFAIYFSLACFCLGLKQAKLEKKIQEINNNAPPDLVGLDLITSQVLRASDFEQGMSLQVVAPPSVLRNLIPAFVEADAARDTSIIVIAPEGEENLLEEITYVLRERGEKERRSFFYYSQARPKLSVSYSPLYSGAENGISNLLGRYLPKFPDSQEEGILDWMLTRLRKLNKPFKFEDLFILLQNKDACLAITEPPPEDPWLRYQQSQEWDYLSSFDKLREKRQSLSIQLERLACKYEFDQYPLIDAFPLDFGDLYKSRKHLYVEIEKKIKPVTYFFLDHLREEIRSHCKVVDWQPYIYVVYPEKIRQQYPICNFIESLFGSENSFPLSYFRIFSEELPYRAASCWNNIVFKSRIDHDANDYFCKWIEPEWKRLKQNANMKSVLNEETIEAAAILWRKMKLTPAAMLIAHRYEGFYGPEGLGYRIVYFPLPPRKKKRYEPFQKQFKAEDQLDLRALIGIQINKPPINKLPEHGGSIIPHMIKDLKPKEMEDGDDL